jgi:phenylacetate-CoA ligase
MLGQLLGRAWELHRRQRLPESRLRDLQNARLRALVRHAYASVPYYRRLLDSRRLRPEDIATVDDLAKLPVLTRAELARGDLADFLASGVDPRRCATSRTSGSSGRLLTLYHTGAEKAVSDVSYLRAHLANGLRPWHRQVTFGPDFRLRGPKHWLDRLRGPRKLRLSNARDVRENVDRVRAFRPHVLVGSNQYLALLARVVGEQRIRDIRPRIVIGSATLLDPRSRALIDDTFGVRMVDEYASAEAGCIAWECPAHSGYHVSADTVVVEFLRDGRPARPDEPGRVVVTPLFRRTMPLVRYDQGDIGVPTTARCPCGRTLPLMRVVEGRSDACITLPSGAILYPAGVLASLTHGERAVAECRVIQEARESIVVQVVLRHGGDARAAQRVQQGMERIVRHEAAVRVELVERIEHDPDKPRSVISRVPPAL